MVNYNLMPFTATIDDPARLKHMATVKSPLQTVYDGKIETLRLRSTKNSLLELKKINAQMTSLKMIGR
jgi:hypothetical protein